MVEKSKTPEEKIADLERQLAELRGTTTAENTGLGAIGQGDHSATAGAGGTAIVFKGNIYQGEPAQDPEQALSIYLRSLIGRLGKLPMRGLDADSGDACAKQDSLDLAGVYIALDTTDRIKEQGKKGKEERERSLRVLEVAAGLKRLVILGDPGSGKSTFVNHLALCLARHHVCPECKSKEQLSDWSKEELDLLPVPIILRDFAAWCGRDEVQDCLKLSAFTSSRLKTQNMSFVGRHIEEKLEKGQALVLLDGLDEVGKEQREAVRDSITAFVDRYPDSRFIVTCRILSYARPEWQLKNKFVQITLAPFHKEQIDQFIAAWYAGLLGNSIVPGKQEADSLTESLQSETRRGYLSELASNPLLLTIMAVVHTHRGRLPGSRALLYEECIDILLHRWEQVKAADQGRSSRLRELLEQAGRQKSDLHKLLRRLAFKVHGHAGKGQLADIGAWQLQKALVKLHPERSHDWATQVVAAVRERAGLLIERDEDVYTFPHRTFQEYLAGAHLAGLGDFSRQAVQLADDPNWHQVILLAVGHLTFCTMQSDPVRSLLDRLCPQTRKDTPSAWRRAWIAGDAVLEMERKRLLEDDGADLDRRIRNRLVDLLSHGALKTCERVAAGNALARLGDPRFRADRWFLPDEELLGFVEIPAGEFLMGDYEEETSCPLHSLHLQRYFIGHYPVTRDQFRAFIDNSGYSPLDRNCSIGIVNHPVDKVSWYDAVAYCKWLDQELRRSPDIPEPLSKLLQQGWQVRLPSEAEWEKAARGQDGRMYPWGEEKPDAKRANFQKSEIKTTSPAGCFPGGASPYGLLDCSGNLWEWTRSLWGENWEKPNFTYPYDSTDSLREDVDAGRDVLRVLRGGSYFQGAIDLACAYRFRFSPDILVEGFWGFRIVLAPSTPSGL
ncbi:hypothetical protein KKHLCK_06830 [Candidatus Electrothrix laxa]